MLHFTGPVAISAGGCYPEITSCLSPVEIVVALKLNKCVDQVDEKIAEKSLLLFPSELFNTFIALQLKFDLSASHPLSVGFVET